MPNQQPPQGGELDREDRIAILQLLSLTPDERLDYFVDEVEFVEATRVVERADA